MKKAIALLLALCLPLSCAAAEGRLLENNRMELNPAANTFACREKRTDDYYVVDAQGNRLSDGYAAMSVKKSGYEVVNENGVNTSGLLDGQGGMIMPLQYGDIEWLSDRWQAGVVLTEATEENYDYKSLFGDGFYLVDHVDFYYQGQLAGSLSRDDYRYADAYGDYLCVTNQEGGRAFYNKAMEKSAYQGDAYREYEDDYKTGTILHCGSNQPAFVPECTLTADEVTQSIWFKDGVARDLQGNVLFDLGRTYEYTYDFCGDYARVKLNGLYGLVDKTGREILPCQYDEIYYSDDQPFFATVYQLVSKDGLVGFVDLQGNQVSGFTYSASIAKTYYQPFAYLQGLDGKYIVISPKGELPEHYTDVTCRYGVPLFAAVNADGAAGVVDMEGNPVVPFDGTFDSAYDFDISDDGSLVLARCDDGYMLYQQQPVR